MWAPFLAGSYLYLFIFFHDYYSEWWLIWILIQRLSPLQSNYNNKALWPWAYCPGFHLIEMAFAKIKVKYLSLLTSSVSPSYLVLATEPFSWDRASSKRLEVKTPGFLWVILQKTHFWKTSNAKDLLCQTAAILLPRLRHIPIWTMKSNRMRSSRGSHQLSVLPLTAARTGCSGKS